MIQQQIGKYVCFVLEPADIVVVMGELETHRRFLEGLGFEEHPETKEFVGTGTNLYAMSPDDFFDRFSSRDGGEPVLVAQATDGEAFYQIDGLPLVEEKDGNPVITKIHALDVETRAFIEEGISNFRVG